MSTLLVQLTTVELCQSAELPQESLLEIVEYGILEPQGQAPEDWRFDATAPAIARRAWRLHRDLEIEWAGIALVLELMAEREQLCEENRALRQRLSRFER